MNRATRNILGTAAVAGLLWICLELTYSFYASNRPQSPDPVSPSVLTFAYNSLRSGQGWSNLDFSGSIRVEAMPFAPGERAARWMPLYVNGRKEGQRYFPGQRVLIFTSGSFLNAVDIDTDEVIWRVRVGGILTNTPVIDLDSGSIYLLSRKTEQDEEVYFHEFHRVPLDGSRVESLPVSLLSVVPKSHRSYYEKKISRVHCKTALGFNPHVSPKQVFVGCSIATRPEKDHQYGSRRGIHGFVIGVEVESDGSFAGPSGVRGFLTSTMAEQEFTGYDTGVYNLGSGPSVLKDGSLLVSTGNGPTFLEQNNFGCAVVRISGENYTPLKNPRGEPMAFSLNPPGYNECWYYNLEFSSSAVATVEHQGRYISAILAKNGELVVFDPSEISPGSTGASRWLIGETPAYGQPVAWQNDSVQVLTYGHFFSPRTNWDSFLGTQDMIKEIDALTSQECLGYIAADKGRGSQALELYYSGLLRDRYANALESTELKSEIQSFIAPHLGVEEGDYAKTHLWGPYRFQKVLGYSLKKGAQPPQDSDLVVAELDLLEFLEKKPKSSYRSEPLFYLKSKNAKANCSQSFEGLTPLYKFVREKTRGLEEGFYAFSFKLDDELNLLSHWRFHEKNWFPQRAHPALVAGADKESSAFVFAVNEKKPAENDDALLVLLDGASGSVLTSAPFKGNVHFSMPLIVDEFIFLPTKDQGLLKFRMEQSSSLWIRKLSAQLKTLF